MMGGYIRIDKELPTDPRLLEVAARAHAKYPIPGLGDAGSLNAWRMAVLGALVHLWTYADVHLLSTDVLPMSAPALAAICGVPADILRTFPGQWLEIDEDNGVVRLPGYCAKNGLRGRDERRGNKDLQRAQWRDQKRAQRSKPSADCPPGTPIGHASGHASGHANVRAMSTPPPVPVPDTDTSKSKTPLPPPSGGPSADAPEGRRANGTNPRALGANPRQRAEEATQAAIWQPLLARAQQVGFRKPGDFDTPATYETSLRLYERTVVPQASGEPKFA